jgi:predicted O-linked N-acetylglucosamine transferase (SPINDLY family)
MAQVLHQGGRLGEAETIYRRILELSPEEPDTLHLLGLLLFQRGRALDGEPMVLRAIELKPRSPQAHGNLGTMYQAMGRDPDAEIMFRKALELAPEYVEARYNLGLILQSREAYAESVGELTRAISRRPLYAEAWNNLGLARRGLKDDAAAADAFRHSAVLDPGAPQAYYNIGLVEAGFGRPASAAAGYRRTLAIEANLPEAWNNLGNALSAAGDLDRALACFRTLTERRPDFAEGQMNLGNVLMAIGDSAGAISAFERAIELRRDFPEAIYNLGTVRQLRMELPQAIECYRRVLALNPYATEPLSNLGIVLYKIGEFEASVAAFRAAMIVKPDLAEALNNLGNAMTVQGASAEARHAYRQAVTINPDYFTAWCNELFRMQYDWATTEEGLFGTAREIADRFVRPLRAAIRPHANTRDPERRLRVGYLSADFREHPVAFNMESLLAAHDRDRFEVHAFASVAMPDATTQRIMAVVDRWHPVHRLSDAEAADLVRAEEIDILVVLAGQTSGNRPLVGAYKPAPVQVSYHDLTSSGFDTTDYWITDPILHPVSGTRERFTEKLVRLPCFYLHRPPDPAPEVGPPPSIASGSITFGSCNNTGKINPEVVALWARVLHAVPGSRLLLKYANSFANPTVARRYTELFARQGIGAERLILAGGLHSRANHLAFLNHIDIGLDTFPFNGSTTTFEALFMGVPVVTLAGQRFIARVGASMLHQVGLDHLTATTPDGFVAAAVALAGDPTQLAATRAALRGRLLDSRICDPESYAETIESAYRDMWRTWCESSQAR